MEDTKIEMLNSIIDELKLENRKLEYSSAFERLLRRVSELEHKVEVLVEYIKKNKRG
tara:strand:- start:451 stop:621 length:171 start_codon:yes stop_codon:yes gene_type:complete